MAKRLDTGRRVQGSVALNRGIAQDATIRIRLFGGNKHLQIIGRAMIDDISGPLIGIRLDYSFALDPSYQREGR